MIDTPLAILIINRDRDEINTIKSNIRSFAPNSIYVVASDDRSLKERINWLDYHMVICNHQLPDDQAQRANLRLRIQMPYLPFILISSCPEMNKGLFSKSGSPWSIRAIIDRDQLANSSKVFQSVYNSSVETVERERICQIKTRQRNLLMQKFECLLRQALQPINAVSLTELTDLIFGRQKLLEHPIP